MRTSLEFPDPLFRTLKATAAMRGISLREHVLGLIERGMAAANAEPAGAGVQPSVPPLPAIQVKGPLPLAIQAHTSNADLFALLDDA